MNLSTTASLLLSLTLTLAACGAPVTNVIVEADDAGHVPYPVDGDAAAPAPPETTIVKVELPDTATPKLVDAAIVCPDPASCGTVLGPTALTCLAQIDLCYATRSTADPTNNTDNHYDACVDLCQATLLQCQSALVNPDGTVIGAEDGGPAVNETTTYEMCGETYANCCNGCEA
jgi:hypothetical protein